MRRFEESQGFGAIGVIIVIEAIVMCILVLGIDYQNGEWTASKIVVPLILLVNALLLSLRLKISIDHSIIKIAYWPFTRKTIYWRDVQKAEVIKYGWVGGWGMKKHKEYGTIYNTQGDRGLFIELKNGKKFTIGTSKHEELEQFIQSIA